MADYDYLIVGQGLAGSLLSVELIRRGSRVLMVDDNFFSAASQTATGLLNPITGRFMKKSWRAEEFLPYAWQTYRSLEEDCSKRFAVAMPILRYFKYRHQREEIEEMHKAEGGPELIGAIYNDIVIPGLRYYPLGGFETKQSGFINTSVFLVCIRDWLCGRDSYREETASYSHIELTDKGVRYKDVTAGKIVFCEGYRMIHNPWFKYLPMHPAKGEVVIIQSPELKLDRILNHDGLHIVPMGDRDLFYVGATYQRGTAMLPTEIGLGELLEKLTQVVAADFEIISHGSGIRPGVKDRRPLMGIHPRHPQLALFNGFGSKGVSWAPLLSKHFADHLLEEKPLWPEVNISRYAMKEMAVQRS